MLGVARVEIQSVLFSGVWVEAATNKLDVILLLIFSMLNTQCLRDITIWGGTTSLAKMCPRWGLLE
jgi:hypothetical protein